MIFPKAKKIARELDWHKTEHNVFGLYKDYFFNVGDASLLSNPQYKYVTAATDHLTEEQKLKIKSALETNKKILKFSNFEIGDNSIYVQFLEKLTYTKQKTVYLLFDFLADLFRNLGIAEQNKCHACGSTDKLKYYDQNDSGVLLCYSCFREAEKSYDALEREKFSEEKNYLTGFLGSLAFSVPGIIAWVLVAVYLEMVASAMAIVIAFLGLKGYGYFKGRNAKFTKYIIVLSNMASILIANVATIIALLVKEGLTLSQSFTELQTNKAAKDLLFENTMISFILAFFVWIWLLFVLKNKELTIKPADKFEK